MTLSTRRDLLAATAGSLALAGCLGGDVDVDQEAAQGDWQDEPLEDVTTGETFTISEIDRPVVLHTFATYCPTCNSHQDGVSDEYEAVSDQVAFVDLTIDSSDDPDDLRAHAENNGHEWRFGVAPDDVTSDLVDAFGGSVTVSSQSPLIIVCPDGSADAISKPADMETILAAVDEQCG